MKHCNLQLVMYLDENENYCVGFNVPSDGDCQGHSVIASKFGNGGYHGPFTNVNMANWVRSIFMPVLDGQWMDIDVSDPNNVKVVTN